MPFYLQRLNNTKIAGYVLFVSCKEKTKKGHWDVRIYLRDQEGRRSSGPCIRGFYSVGRNDEGASGHFFDTELSSIINFVDKAGEKFNSIDLIDSLLADHLYCLIGRFIRPGGQLFISYATVKRFREHTEKAFELGIPPAATMLGKLVVLSGCTTVWSHYGAEGRFRMEGEKPATVQIESASAKSTLASLEEYLGRDPESLTETGEGIHSVCRENARQLIGHLQGRG